MVHAEWNKSTEDPFWALQYELKEQAAKLEPRLGSKTGAKTGPKIGPKLQHISRIFSCIFRACGNSLPTMELPGLQLSRFFACILACVPQAKFAITGKRTRVTVTIFNLLPQLKPLLPKADIRSCTYGNCHA